MALPPFQALIDEHRVDIYRFLRASVGPDEADDCFQETFIAALRAYPRLRADSNLRGWLFTIAHRKALDSHRARAAGLRRHARVGAGGAERDPRRRLEQAAGERPAHQREVERDVEAAAPAGEVLVELAADLVERGGRLEHTRRDPPCQLVEQLVGVLVRAVGQPDQAARGDRDQQVAERRRLDCVRHVDQSLGASASERVLGGALRVGGDVPVAAQQVLDRLRHPTHTSLSLRRPSCTLRRAASSVEPSASPISR